MLIIASILLYMFHLYFQTLNSGGIHYVNTERSALNMQVFHNPFTFEVNLQEATYSGIQCKFHGEKDFYLLTVWGVPIYQLFMLLNSTPRNLKHSISTLVKSEKFSKCCKSSNDVLLIKGGEMKTMVFKPYRGNANETDIKPNETFVRLTYPFVAIMVLQEQDISESLVVAMATAVHLPDERLELPAQIVGQHVKLSSGSVNTIRKIYISSPETSRIGGENVDLCLACYHRAISVVIMPCGHACVCYQCLKLCRNCPVCRGSAYSYFELQRISSQ
ncbi:cell growth regulator with RING finger domain protein 1 [Caerostris darwini]|uniref:Cell growth regulator with RING finger domain protein 1 n=1 Tax=Caerostris darwini TaxID=1538125 RepID=A0AAV4RF61_9ARAC|nr:cell growth regulator with RING finger domain protein 1 [Caerostris darwini]